MRRNSSIYLPSGLEYLISQWCAKCVDVVNRLEFGRGAGMVGSGASFAAAPRSSRQLASTFLYSTFTIFAMIQIAARDVQEGLELISSLKGRVSWDPER
jgi:hypothetical protein